MATASKAKKENLPSWDLKDFYKNIKDPAIKKDITKAQAQAEAFEKAYKCKVVKLDAAGLLKAIKSYEALNDLIGKLASYAFLSYATEVSNPEKQAFYQGIEEKINDISAKLLFFTLELNCIDDKKLKGFFKHEGLDFYMPYIRNVRAWKKYQLSDKEEEVIHEKDLTGRSAWVRFFDQLEAKLRFKLKGKEYTLAEIMEQYVSHKSTVRRDAAKAISQGLNTHIETFTFITNILAKDKDIEDRRRGFKEPISSRNVANYVEDEVVETLIQTVKANYKKLSHRYYKIKAKWMGKKVLNYWDRNAPLMEVERKIPWEEAVETVMQAYNDFSPTMVKIARMFVDKKWIDVPAQPGKMFGAFSHGTVPSMHPYILLNYKHKVRDVMTLAHELGHGVHQYLARKEGALISNTPLTIAETASVFGEQLTFRALLKKEKKEKTRRALIASKVEDMLNTVVRQIAFCEFERQVHAARKHGELHSDAISRIWMQVQKESLGDAIKLDNDYACYWTYISHFIHTPFYVYAYAFGDCFVNSLYAVYESGKVKNFEEKYIDVLSSGGRLRYDEFLKPFGLNPKDKKFWQYGLDKIAALIDELED